MRSPAHEALARATLAHGLIQLAVHFPDTLREMELTTSEALERALALAEQAILLAPTQPDGFVALGRLLLCHDAEQALDDAIDMLRHAHELDPEHDGAEIALAATLRERGLLREALIHVDAVLKRGNGQAQALTLRALIMLDTGHPDEARRDIERAVRIAPEAGLIHLDAAKLMGRLGAATEAHAHEARAASLLGQTYAAIKRALLQTESPTTSNSV